MKRLLPLVLLAAASGCSSASHRGAPTGLASLAFAAGALPKDVYLAPWTGGSDKFPWVTSNPFRSEDRQVISEFLEDGEHVEKGSVAEVFVVVYWVGKPNESPVEMGLTALRFKNPASASQMAKAMQPQIDENARVEPHTAPTLLRHGSTVCIVSHTSAVDEAVWSAMVRLVASQLAMMP